MLVPMRSDRWSRSLRLLLRAKRGGERLSRVVSFGLGPAAQSRPQRSSVQHLAQHRFPYRAISESMRRRDDRHRGRKLRDGAAPARRQLGEARLEARPLVLLLLLFLGFERLL